MILYREMVVSDPFMNIDHRILQIKASENWGYSIMRDWSHVIYAVNIN